MLEVKKLRKVPPEAFRRQLLTVFPVFLNSFITGSTNGWSSNAIYFFHRGQPESFTLLQCSIIVSSNEMGRMLFSLPSGFLTDRIERKKIMIIAGIVHLVAWIMLSFFSSYLSIIIARFILGIGYALVNSANLITIGEISSPEIRAKISSINQLFFNVGQLFPSILSILFSSYYIISYNLTIFASLYFLSLHWLIETPYFLVSKSKYDKAKVNLKIIRIGYPESEINEEFENFRKYIEDEKKRKQELNWLKFICSKRILKPIIIAIVIHYFVQGIGGIVISAYVTKIIPKFKFIPIKYYPFISQVSRISAALFTPFFIELWPRRTVFLSITLLGFVNLMILGAAHFCLVQFSFCNNLCQWIVFVCSLLGAGVVSTIIHTMSTTIRGEYLPQTIKGLGGSICVMATSGSNVVQFQIYRFVTQNYSLYWIFFIFSFNAIILFFVIYFALPETRGKYLADIQVKGGKEDDNKEVLGNA